MLSVNDDILRTMPYFNDEEPDEITNLTHLFRDEIKSLPKRNLQQEKKIRLLPIVYRMLEEFKCSPDSILRFLRKGISASYNIESKAQAGDESVHYSLPSEKLEQSKELTNIILVSRSDRDRLIANLCEATRIATGIGLGAILQSDYKITIPRRDNSSAETTKGSTLESLLCSICFM